MLVLQPGEKFKAGEELPYSDEQEEKFLRERVVAVPMLRPGQDFSYKTILTWQWEERPYPWGYGFKYARYVNENRKKFGLEPLINLPKDWDTYDFSKDPRVLKLVSPEQR